MRLRSGLEKIANFNYDVPRLMNENPLKNVQSTMRSRFLYFFQDKFFSTRQVRYLLLLAAFINSIIWIAILIKIRPLSQSVPLHFNSVSGIEEVNQGFLLLRLPGFGLVFLIFDLLIARFFFTRENFLSYFFLYAVVVLQLLVLVAVLNVFFLSA